FQRGGCTSQYYRAMMILSSPNGNVTCMIARRFALLVCVFMLFINNDNTKFMDGRKDRRTGTYNDVCLSPDDFTPLIILFSVRQSAVQNSHLISKSPFESGNHLRSK